MMKHLFYLSFLTLVSIQLQAAYHQEQEYDSPIHRAVRSGQLDKAEVILKIQPGAVDKKAAYGQRPLHIAAKIGNTKMVELLISYNATLNALDNQKRTPLHTASEHNQKEIVSILIAAGAEIEAKDTLERTPLEIAILKKNDKAAQALIDAGANTLNVERYRTMSFEEIEACEE